MAQAAKVKKEYAMEGRMVRRMLLVSTIALLAAPLTSAAQEPPGKSTSKREGIERARAIGMQVDPAAEEMMAAAPVGSCANDPTQAKCPPSRAVVYSPEFFHIEEDQLPAADRAKQIERPVAEAARRVRVKARAAVVYGCYLKVAGASPYYAAGYAQMDANNYCLPGVNDVDIYLLLRKYSGGQWNNMIGAWRYPMVPQRYWYGHLNYRCTAYPRRWWIAQAQGFANVNGVWYAGYATQTGEIPCA